MNAEPGGAAPDSMGAITAGSSSASGGRGGGGYAAGGPVGGTHIHTISLPDDEMFAIANAVRDMSRLNRDQSVRVLAYLVERFTPNDPLPTPSSVFHADGHECDASLVLGAINAAVDEARNNGVITHTAHRRIVRTAQNIVRDAVAERGNDSHA